MSEQQVEERRQRPAASPTERSNIRDKIRRIKIQRTVFKVTGWVFIVLALIFFGMQWWAVAIPVALGAVAMALLADWVVKPADEL